MRVCDSNDGSIGLVYGQRMYCACVRGAGVRCSNARQLPGDKNNIGYDSSKHEGVEKSS